jgi:hypothetical protein
MTTIEITKEKLNLFVICAKHYVNANITRKSMLWINADTLLPIAVKKLKKVERERDLVRMKYGKKTSTKHIEFDKKGNYQFTEDDNKKVLDEFDRIDSETVEMPIMIVPTGEYPQKGLSYDIRSAFKGILIPENEYDTQNPDLQKLLDEENARVEQEDEEENQE